MSNNTGLTPFNGHRIQGRSSESFIDAREVISRLNLKGNEVFMDAGCGDGHAALIAQDTMNDDAIIYALDVYEPSIEDLEKDVKEKGLKNLIPIQSDITGDINLSNDSLDVILMINVFHGFVARNNVDEAISELKRITRHGGKIAIMDYKKMETKYGPPFQVRSSPEELEKMFEKHGLNKFNLDIDIGEDLDDGMKSHYLIEFKK